MMKLKIIFVSSVVVISVFASLFVILYTDESQEYRINTNCEYVLATLEMGPSLWDNRISEDTSREIALRTWELAKKYDPKIDFGNFSSLGPEFQGQALKLKNEILEDTPMHQWINPDLIDKYGRNPGTVVVDDGSECVKELKQNHAGEITFEHSNNE